VDYFRRLAPLLAEDARGAVLLKLGAVLELRGDWAEAEGVFGEALALAERRGDVVAVARARVARAEPMRKQGRYDDAMAELDLAGHSFGAAGDDTGLGRVAHLRGTIAAQRGDYAEARAQYERSLAIRVALADGPAEASVLSNLAIVAEYEQDYDRAQALNEQALELRARLGDRWGIGVSRNNLGMLAYIRRDYASARAHLEEALRTGLEVGDMWVVAHARHNLGNSTRELGDVAAACRNYSEALTTFALTGDRWAQCILFEDLALAAAATDPRAALRLVGVAEAVRESIGSPRVVAAQAELDERLRPARELLGREATTEHEAGTKLTPEAALQMALQLCGAGLELPPAE
jgi:tetratricopeptide (TPR) repeat protein